jgi:hypothetical protein
MRRRRVSSVLGGGCRWKGWGGVLTEAFLLGIVAYYVAFGPHGPRAPSSKPGDGYKIVGSVAVLVAAAGLLSIGLRQFGASLFPTSVALLPQLLICAVVCACSPARRPHYDQGVAGGVERARQGDEAQPYLWYVLSLLGRRRRSLPTCLRDALRKCE